MCQSELALCLRTDKGSCVAEQACTLPLCEASSEQELVRAQATREICTINDVIMKK